MTDIFWAGMALVLVFEGILPFVAPRLWRDTFRRAIEFSDAKLRVIGLLSMVGGLLTLYFVR